ncbi:MAG: DUF1176 domain-containing protein [Zoogloeaceae bacterium]|nr:DUF1176 domain-containing protein [Zoogloeaceae bacterium]
MKIYNDINDIYPLALGQIRALLAAARGDRAIEFKEKSIRGEAVSFTLSGKGISAILLKMEEVQGRVDTPG